MKFYQTISVLLFILVIIIIQDFQQQLFNRYITSEKIKNLWCSTLLMEDKNDQYTLKEECNRMDSVINLHTYDKRTFKPPRPLNVRIFHRKNIPSANIPLIKINYAFKNQGHQNS